MKLNNLTNIPISSSGEGGGDTKFPQPYNVNRFFTGGGYSSSVRRGEHYYTSNTTNIEGTDYYLFGSVDSVDEVIVDGFSISDKTLVCIGVNKFYYNTSINNFYGQEKINNIYIYFQKNSTPNVQFVSEENVMYYSYYGEMFYPNKNVVLKSSGTLTFTNVRVYYDSGTYAYAWGMEEANTNSADKINYNEFISIPDFDSNSHYYYVRYLTRSGYSMTYYSSLVTSDLSSYKEVTLSLTNCTCPYQKVLVNDISKLKIPVKADSGYVLPLSVSASDITVTYDSDGYILNNCSANTTVSITAQAAPSGHTVTINLNGAIINDSTSSNTLTVDSSSYYVNGSLTTWDTDYPYNGIQITAQTVSITGDGFRWKDSDTSTWQTNVDKTWTIPRDNFEIWIEVDYES